MAEDYTSLALAYVVGLVALLIVVYAAFRVAGYAWYQSKYKHMRQFMEFCSEGEDNGSTFTPGSTSR